MFEVEEYARRVKANIDSWLLNYIEREYPPPLNERLKYAVSGGKRLRGILLVLIHDLNGGDGEVYDLAAAVEMAHSASLIHDDLADNAKERRNSDSFWARYGVDEAVTVPHILISDALKIVGARGANLLAKVIDAWKKASLGQFYDISSYKGVHLVRYDVLARLKSGEVFGASCFLGAETAEKGLGEKAYSFGLHLGTAYQAIDDAVSLLRREIDSGSTALLIARYREDAINHVFNLARKELDEALRLADEVGGLRLREFVGRVLELMAREAGVHSSFILNQIALRK